MVAEALPQTACMRHGEHPDLRRSVVPVMQVSVESVHSLAQAALLCL